MPRSEQTARRRPASRRKPERDGADNGQPGAHAEGAFAALARKITHFTGTTAAFFLALGTVVVWGVTGPLFGYSDTWQLVINTGTTIVTFLMVFLIQRAQNRDALAVQLKLNEIIASLECSSNRLVNVEDLSEEELDTLHRHYAHLVDLARTDSDIHTSHSIEEAEARAQRKQPSRGAGSRGTRKT